MDRGAWQATVYGVAKSKTQPNDWARTHTSFSDRIPFREVIKALEKGGVCSMSRQTEPGGAWQGDLQALKGSTAVEGRPVLRDLVPPEQPRSSCPFTSCHGKSSRTRHPEERGADPMWLRWRLRHWWHRKLELEVQLCQGKQRSLCCFLTWVCRLRFVSMTRGFPRDLWQRTSELRRLRAVASSLWENWIEEMRGPQRLLIILEILLSLLSVVAQRVKNLSAMQETRVRSLGLEDTLEEGMATHSSIPA